MKIIIEKGKEKNIPKRYESFFNPQLMEDWTKKRLTKKERLNLEFEYVKSNLSKYELEFIGNSKPVSVNAVQTRNDVCYYIIVLDNNKDVRCDASVFKYVNSGTIKRNY
jgi:hypothetical protein